MSHQEQTKKHPQIRLAVAVALVARRARLEECCAPTPGQDTGMSTMPGMDHSKMTPVEIAFTSQPALLRIGDNRFDVIVTSADGQPIADADVSVILVMPAMPAMNVPEMRNEFLRHNVKLPGQDDASCPAAPRS